MTGDRGDLASRAMRDAARMGVLLAEARQTIDRQVREIRFLRDLLAAAAERMAEPFTLQELHELTVIEEGS